MANATSLISITALCLTLVLQTQTACAQSKGTIREKIRERIEEKKAERSRAPENAVAQIQVGGLTRTYLLHVPPSHERGKLLPVVFVFHGGKSQAQLMMRYTGMSKLADRDGFLVVYPEGVDKHWSNGRQNAPKVDDVGFVLALIDLWERLWASTANAPTPPAFQTAVCLPNAWRVNSPARSRRLLLLRPRCRRTWDRSAGHPNLFRC